MKKYLIIFRNQVQRQLAYRETIFSYIIGNLLELSIQIIIWMAIFAVLPTVSGYTKNEMITYIVFGWFFMFFTSNYNIENQISKHIQDGQLSTFLLKPQSYIKYVATISLGRISIPAIAVLIQLAITAYILKDALIFSFTPEKTLVILAMMVMSYVLKFCLSLIIGLASFWTIEVGGLYQSLDVIMKFFSGGFFPLTLFPGLYGVSKFLPFMHTFFIPSQFFLGKIGSAEAFFSLLVQAFWIGLLYGIVKYIWVRGLRYYESVGI
jgi:ABC-2 type transport system permease protein